MNGRKSPTEPPALSQWLRQLPQHQPPDGLWTKILQSHSERQQRSLRRRTAVAAAAMAASLVMALALLLSPSSRLPAAVDGDLGRVADLMEQTGRLEQVLQQQAARFASLAAARQQLVMDQQAQLVALDQALANAYERRDSPGRLAELWQRRVDLMNGLVLLYGNEGEKT